VLVCPLDWGLGHASRMIPVIQRFTESGYQIFLGGSGKSGELLKMTFPELPYIQIPSTEIRYARDPHWLLLKLICQIPGLILSAIREHQYVKSIIEKHRINILVSDNRYGLFCRKAYCIFVTHQISPVLPPLLKWAEYPLYLMLRIIIGKYNECWIPDTPHREMNLTGKLSHRFKIPENAKYVGILSRFTSMYDMPIKEPPEKYELAIILSGPEPHLTILLQSVLALTRKMERKTIIITGFNTKYPVNSISNTMITVVSHLDQHQFYQVIKNAGVIICRSGYSSIMDLIALQKTAILIPTPGQTEQIYLAENLTRMGYFSYLRQDQLDPDIVLNYLNERSFINNCQINSFTECLPITGLLNKKNG